MRCECNLPITFHVMKAILERRDFGHVRKVMGTLGRYSTRIGKLVAAFSSYQLQETRRRQPWVALLRLRNER